MDDMDPKSEVEPVTARSVWDMLKLTASSWNEINAPRLGAALAFYTMLSLAPLLVVSIGVAGFIFGEKAAQDQVVAQIRALVGSDGGRAIQSLLESAAKPASGMLAAGVGLLFLFFGASGVFGELRDSLDLVWGVKPAYGKGIPGLIRYRFVSFAMVLGIGFLLLVSLVFTAAIAAAGKIFGGYLPLPESVLQIFNMVLSFAAVTFLFALMYKVVPDIRIEWRDVWIGAAVTSLLFSLGKFLIGLYLGKASIGSAYGAAGSLVVLLVWVYYSAQIFFLGAEFTHAFAERHGSRAEARTQHRRKLTELRDGNTGSPRLA
jgi:membrane protein